MLKNVVIALLAVACFWFYTGNSLTTFEGCVDGYFHQFTGIKDRKIRKARAEEVCQELVVEGKILPSK